MKNDELPYSLQTYFAVMEITASIRDVYQHKFSRRFSIDYDALMNDLDHLYNKLDKTAELVEKNYKKDQKPYQIYESHLQLVNETINDLYTNVRNLKIKSEGGKYSFSENKQNIKRFHDTYDALTDSANNLKYLSENSDLLAVKG